MPSAQAQNTPPSFTRHDTLRGSITPERVWWDLTHYDLSIKVNPKDSTFQGMNKVTYRVLKPHQTMQLDLQPPMRMERVVQNGQNLVVRQDGNAWFIQLQEPQVPGAVQSVEVYYSGKPQVSVNPPWTGGVTWKQDAKGNPFIATSVQGDGASLFWPNKDHMYDEPDSMMIRVNVPMPLVDVSNGRLRKVEEHPDRTRTYHWAVTNPINNYGVNVNVGVYTSFYEVYPGEKGPLDCTYYVLPENLEKAKVQFKDVPRMLKAFEHWFGPYPFYEDGYKLVEVPYLGMEHQSSVTYGNKYQNGYLGRDLSGTGWGLKFDFIIIHESGHEWFANNITYKDIADMWVHEAFTAYSENLFLDYHYGKEASSAYVIGTRKAIKNDRPVVGKYDLNYPGSGDMYYKGANMLHTLRQLVGNDKKWRKILRGLNQDFYHQTVTGAQIEQYLVQKTGMNLTAFFDQYLRNVRIPELEYQLKGNKLSYRWTNCLPTFAMPVKVLINGKPKWLKPVANSWKDTKVVKGSSHILVEPNFYVTGKRLEVE
nr:M1 family metallopeptidase [Rufibacter radiotolerans]